MKKNLLIGLLLVAPLAFANISGPSIHVLKGDSGASRIGTSESISVQEKLDSLSSLSGSISSVQDDVDANTSAIGGLDTRVTSVEGSVTTQASDITTLQSDVSNNAASSSSNATAIGGLDTRVTSVEGSVTTQASDITTLQSSVSSNAASSSSNATAIGGLDTRVTSVEGDVTTQASDITTLQTSVGSNTAEISTLTTSVDGNSARWEVKTSVNDLEGDVGFYNDGQGVKFGITVDGTTGLIWDGSELNIAGTLRAEDIKVGKLDTGQIQAGAVNENNQVNVSSVSGIGSSYQTLAQVSVTITNPEATVLLIGKANTGYKEGWYLRLWHTGSGSLDVSSSPVIENVGTFDFMGTVRSITTHQPGVGVHTYRLEARGAPSGSYSFDVDDIKLIANVNKV